MLIAHVFMDFHPPRLQFGLYGFESRSRDFDEVTATELCGASTPLGWQASVTFSNPMPPPWGTAANRKHSTDAVTGRRDGCDAMTKAMPLHAAVQTPAMELESM